MRISTFAGFVLAALSLAYGLITLLVALLFNRQLAAPGIITIIVAIFFFAGVQLFFLGMIGEYILAIYGQVRDKPVVFERERINFVASADHTNISGAALNEPEKRIG